MAGTEQQQPSKIPNADELEVSPGSKREALQGWMPTLATEEDKRVALEKAFSYRGDITITCQNGSKIEGYVFDRRPGTTLADSVVKVILKESGEKGSFAYSDIVGIAFTGLDPAAGKSWEAWMKRYWEKKSAGEKDIRIDPDPLE